jgi:hypothetical protein
MSIEQRVDGIPAPDTVSDLVPDSIGRRRRGILKSPDEQTPPQRRRFAFTENLQFHFQSREIWIAVALGVGVGLLGALLL